MNTEMFREVLTRVVEEPHWRPESQTPEESALVEMAGIGWLQADPNRTSGIGVAERGMERYYQWGGSSQV